MSFRARNIRLRNFRCFEDAVLELHPHLTVIVADNGMGKTALLDALAIAMAEYVDELLRTRTSGGVLPSDVRIQPDGEQPAALEVTGEFDIGDAQWTLTRGSTSAPARRSKKRLGAILKIAKQHREFATNTSATLPIFCFYQSSRFAESSFFERRFSETKSAPVGRLTGFVDYLTPLASGTRFNARYQRLYESVRGSTADGKPLGTDPLANAHLSAIRAAVACVLAPPGWEAIDWDPVRHCVVVEHSVRGRLPLSWLSSGIRSMTALVADLAFRCASLNPILGEDAARQTPGLVLIDEVDLHLHPSWQQRVVDLLRIAFPELQLVLTTHSPQVLSSVDVKSVRVVHHSATASTIGQPSFQTRGVESADILAQIMGVDPIPSVKEAKELLDFRAYIEDGKTESPEISALRRRLLKHFGEMHPVMLDCARLERFVAFKRRRAEGGPSDAQA